MSAGLLENQKMDGKSSWLPRTSIAGTKQSINIMNRLVTWTERGIELEGDARHAEIIIWVARLPRRL